MRLGGNIYRHAYLIMAHKNIEQLKKLLKLLDAPDNDIFLHIDKKASYLMEDINYQKICTKSSVVCVPSIDVKWGVTQIQAELELLTCATDRRGYAYYHLLSGMDLPLKSQTVIHNFFENNSGKNFVNFSGMKKNERAQYYWFPEMYDVIPHPKFRALAQKADMLQVGVQKRFRVNRLKKQKISDLYHGANWFSITDELARKLVKYKEQFLREFQHSYCCDEVFIQSYIISNPRWLETLYKPISYNGFESIARCIDWNRGSPYTWRKEDYSALIQSNYLFARKFDETVDSEIVERIFKYVNEQ